jgi:hypothetical protein
LVLGGAVGLAFLWVAPTVADAATAGPDWLQWTRGTGAESCVDAAGFAAQVEAELGPMAGRRPADHPRVAVSIGRVGSGGGAPQWSADLRLMVPDGQPTGSRHLERDGDSCDPLTEGLALMVTLLLAGEGPGRAADPVANVLATAATTRAPGSVVARAQSGQAPAPAASTGTAVAATTLVPTLDVETSRAARSSESGVPVAPAPGAPPPSWTLAFEGGPAAGLGALPGLAAAVEARFWVNLRRGPALFATADLWRSKRTRIDGNNGNGAELDLWTAGWGVCPLAPTTGSTRGFAACLVGDVGRLGAAGFGFEHSLSAGRWTGDAGVETGLRQHLGSHTFLAFGLRLLAPLTRHNITYRDESGTTLSIYRVAPVLVIAGLRVGAAFP